MNPYDSATPEWQLYENMRSNEQLAAMAAAEAAIALERGGGRAREKADLYRKALDKLTTVVIVGTSSDGER